MHRAGSNSSDNSLSSSVDCLEYIDEVEGCTERDEEEEEEEEDPFAIVEGFDEVVADVTVAAAIVVAAAAVTVLALSLFRTVLTIGAEFSLS